MGIVTYKYIIPNTIKQDIFLARKERLSITMDGPLDDDYVANLLKEDAKKASQNAALIGMGAYMPQKYVYSPPPTYTILIQDCLEQMVRLPSQINDSYAISFGKPTATTKHSLRKKPKNQEQG